MSRMIIRIWVYALPFPLFLIMYFSWFSWSKSSAFALYVMLLPLLYGYVVPGIGTNLLRKWRFSGPWAVGSYYAHHGFMYAANMSPLLFISFLGSSAFSWAMALRILLCTAALHGFVLWIHDILIVKHKMVEIFNRPNAEGRSPEEIVFYYAPLCFFLIGLTYAASSLLAFWVFVVCGEVTPASLAALYLTGFALMFSIPSLAYRYLEGAKRP
jgi:hypothetical protein